jgi:hypothetical protein
MIILNPASIYPPISRQVHGRSLKGDLNHGSEHNRRVTGFVVLAGLTSFLTLPAIIIWGWMRWARAKSRHPEDLCSILSLISFVLSSASASLAASGILYAWFVHPFPFYDPVLMKIYAVGGLLSAASVLFAAGGVWKANPLRWHAAASGIGMLLFWFASAVGE